MEFILYRNNTNSIYIFNIYLFVIVSKKIQLPMQKISFPYKISNIDYNSPITIYKNIFQFQHLSWQHFYLLFYGLEVSSSMTIHLNCYIIVYCSHSGRQLEFLFILFVIRLFGFFCFSNFFVLVGMGYCIFCTDYMNMYSNIICILSKNNPKQQNPQKNLQIQPQNPLQQINKTEPNPKKMSNQPQPNNTNVPQPNIFHPFPVIRIPHGVHPIGYDLTLLNKVDQHGNVNIPAEYIQYPAGINNLTVKDQTLNIGVTQHQLHKHNWSNPYGRNIPIIEFDSNCDKCHGTGTMKSTFTKTLLPCTRCYQKKGYCKHCYGTGLQYRDDSQCHHCKNKH